MKIIFVGMHNKPGLKPLCSSTKTGKIINRIIKELPNIEVLKTNLYNVEYLPYDWREKQDLSVDWHQRIDAYADDIIILLGAEVQEWFISSGFRNIIKLAHPAYKAMNKYVADSVEKIKEVIGNDKTMELLNTKPQHPHEL